MTEPSVPSSTVSADVPVDEPVATPPAGVAEPAPEVVPEPVTPDPAAPGAPSGPPTSPVAPAAPEPITPSPAAPPAVPAPPAEPVTPPEAPPPAEPVAPPAPPEPAEPVAPPEPPPPAEPVTPPDPVPPAEPVEPAPAVEAGLAAAAATTEVAPHPVVPVTDEASYVHVEPRSRRGMVVGALGAVLVLGLAAFAFVTARDAAADRRVADRRADALSEARQLALNLVSLNYKTLDDDLKRISDSTTGTAREQFDERILSNESYKKLVVENQAVITSKITRMGLEPCGTEDSACKKGDTAVVLVFLDQESKNKLRTTPRVDRNRVALTLVRRDESWLVSKVEVL